MYETCACVIHTILRSYMCINIVSQCLRGVHVLCEALVGSLNLFKGYCTPISEADFSSWLSSIYRTSLCLQMSLLTAWISVITSELQIIFSIKSTHCTPSLNSTRAGSRGGGGGGGCRGCIPPFRSKFSINTPLLT